MEYLKEYDFTDEQIYDLKETYNDEICIFFLKNKEFIQEKLNFLKEENITILYDVLYNNIKVFLEEIEVLKNKVKIMKEHNLSDKVISMILIDEDLYDQIV